MPQQHNYPNQQHYNKKHNNNININNINNNNNSINNNQIINSKGDIESNVNHVLLITVINPHYPINCEIIHMICSNYGKVNRIVIFKKNGVQAMVEFDNVEQAKRARSLLHGCDIYSGCCTLRVEFAKPTRLNVHKNNSESFDYTNLSLELTGGDDEHDQQHSEHHHQASTHHHHQHAYQNHRPMHHPQQHGKGLNMTGRHAQHPHHPHHPHSHHPSHHHSSFGPQSGALMAGPAGGMSPQGTVMMVYGLNSDRVNCDRLFNLFCLYGNVVRVKFLRTKEGCAMVQMGDILAVDRCVSSLNKITLFGNELQISYSKQASLHDVVQPFILPDGSPSFKDFMGNKNNRFKNPEVASKNRILPPSQVLHFFNAPYGITEDELIHLFRETAEHEPISLKIFSPKTETSKSNSGLVTFRDPVEATETLILCNHLSMPRAGAPHPYILRLCFSPPTYARHQQQSQQVAQELSSPASSVAAASVATGAVGGNQLASFVPGPAGAGAVAGGASAQPVVAVAGKP